MTILSYVLIGVATSATPEVPLARSPFHTEDNIEVAQMTIRQRIIVRVPAVSVRAPPVPLPRPIVWKEVKGPKCLAINQLAGAAITKQDAVDLFLRGGRRLRAQLDDGCPALDYYGGFYIAPSKDGQVCGGRDPIHTRAGGKCRIERFRELVPKR